MGRKLARLSGHLNPYWTKESVEKIPYVTPPNPHIGFDLVDELDQERYAGLITADRVTELPDVLQSDQLYKEFDWLENKIYAVHRMNPGTLLPMHRDLYRYFKNSNGIEDINDIVRAIIFLDDWHSGQILEIEGKMIVNWRAGDWVTWYGGDAHLAANLGHETRYTLQITGIAK